jgi:co-chaperonin GroES (HSP10)
MSDIIGNMPAALVDLDGRPIPKVGAASELAIEDRPKQLPDPAGYRILCAIPDIEKKTDGGIIKADITLQHEELLTVTLFVMKLGPDCYKDKKRFPSGPWCKEGDFVLVRPHAGTRVKIHGREFRIINDDAIEGTVEDPRGIKRA